MSGGRRGLCAPVDFGGGYEAEDAESEGVEAGRCGETVSARCWECAAGVVRTGDDAFEVA